MLAVSGRRRWPSWRGYLAWWAVGGVYAVIWCRASDGAQLGYCVVSAVGGVPPGWGFPGVTVPQAGR